MIVTTEMLGCRKLVETELAALIRASCEMTERCFDETLVIERYWQVLQRRAPAMLQVRGGDHV